MKFLSKYNKVIDELQWKYFIGEFKPKEQQIMEKQFLTLSATDKKTAREMSILLNNISEDQGLKQELGLNPYNLYPIGLSCFVNFRDLSNLITYKVHDLTQSGQLFGTDIEKGVNKYSSKDIDTLLKTKLPENKVYLNNFNKGYILIKLPEGMDDKTIDLDSITKPLEFKSTRFDKPTNTVIIETK